MAQKDIELILLKQWASYLTLPIFLAGEDGLLLYYNEPAEAILGMRFDEAGEMPLERLSTIFQTTAEDGSPLDSDELPIGIALRERQPAHRRLRIQALDGVARIIEATALPLEGAGDRHLGALVVFWEARS
jgi:hypothetical protein